MSTATVTPPARVWAEPPRRRLTLEQRLDRTLEEVRSGTGAACPVCRAPMTSRAGAAHCTGCGCRLD